MMEAVSTSETLINYYETTWCNIPEGCHLRTCHLENQKSHINWMLISAQVQGLNIPMRRGTMADIHESESSLNESSSTSQGVEQDERRYDYILTDREF
jgi:hypothetical protein